MKRHLTAAAAGIAALAACSDGTGPGSGNPAVSLSFTTGSPATASASRTGFFASRAALADTVIEGSDTLIITRAQLVLREIELERVESTTDCGTTAVDDDDCEEFEVGPLLVDLPLNGQVAREISVDIPDGSYDELEFEIHKVNSDDEEDADFRAANPEFAGISIRVEGTFNGQTFVFTSDLDVEQELDLNPPLVVDASGGPTNVTILVSLDGWFRTASGAVVNPETGNKGGVNESLIKENIKQSIEAFEDEDEDGDDDDGPDHDS